MPNEVTLTDQFVRKELDKAGLVYTEQGSDNPIINEALKNASKTGKGIGKPEFVIIYESLDLIVVIEDKKDNHRLEYIKEDGALYLTAGPNSPVSNFAVNGAVHYAKNIIEKTYFKNVLAIGVTGSEKNHLIQPYFVSESGIKKLPVLETLINLSNENIEEFYRIQILGEKSSEEILVEDLIVTAKELHEDLRNYGQLKEEEKPLVVSGILLALEDEYFKPEDLKGKKKPTDGSKILESISTYLDEAKVAPEEKKKILVNQFQFIKDRTILNEINPHLKMTPLKHFALKIKKEVRKGLKQNVDYDILGRFYSEFIRYSGGDGRGLGIVLTPTHITKLFAQLLDVKPTDIVLDTCTGTAGFLISAMHEMIKKTKDPNEIKKIKSDRLHGVELREDLFTIATTNMILRGDGKSNLRRGDYLRIEDSTYEDIGATVGMINPPYSQAKNAATKHLSEMNFIIGLLDRLDIGGRGAAIVPQSVMIGKSNYDKEKKKEVLSRHSLEAVITLPGETFYPTGTNPVIAIFTAHVPHDFSKRVKFINFEDDGFIKHKTLGRIPTELSKDKFQHLLDVYFDRLDASNNFMIKSEIKSEDEWLHAFYYFNDEIPSEELFQNKLADFLSFKFDQTVHGREYLFGNGDKDE